MTDVPIGRVKHFWPKAEACSLELTEPLRLGDRLRIVGHGHDVEQVVTSIHVAREPRKEAQPGEPAAVHVDWRVHEGDRVFLVREDASLTRGRWSEPPERW